MITPVYKSQWGVGATRRINDCGPACVSMFLSAIGDHTPIDQLRTDDPTGLTTAHDLIRIFAEHGVNAHYELIPGLDVAKPNSILLINYAPIAPYAQDIRFKGWHWLIYLGNDGHGAYVHDPDYWGNRINEGNAKQYPVEALRTAFRPYTQGSLAVAVVVDGVMEIEDEIDMAVTKYINNPPGVNVRVKPAGKVIAELGHGAQVSTLDYRKNAALSGVFHSWRAIVLADDTLGYVSDKFLVDAPPV